MQQSRITRVTRKSVIIKFFKVFLDHRKERRLITSLVSNFPEYEVFYLDTSFKERLDCQGVKEQVAPQGRVSWEPRVKTRQARAVSMLTRVIIPRYLNKKRIGPVMFQPIAQRSPHKL